MKSILVGGERQSRNSEQPLPLWGSGHFCLRGCVSPCLLPATSSGWVQKATGGVLSSWPLWVRVKSKQENGKGVNKWRLGKKPGDSGRASRGRMLGGLALILWVLHLFLPRGWVSIPSQPSVASSSWTWDKWGRPGNQGQKRTCHGRSLRCPVLWGSEIFISPGSFGFKAGAFGLASGGRGS